MPAAIYTKFHGLMKIENKRAKHKKGQRVIKKVYVTLSI
jgi:hypothetical protein